MSWQQHSLRSVSLVCDAFVLIVVLIDFFMERLHLLKGPYIICVVIRLNQTHVVSCLANALEDQPMPLSKRILAGKWGHDSQLNATCVWGQRFQAFLHFFSLISVKVFSLKFIASTEPRTELDGEEALGRRLSKKKKATQAHRLKNQSMVKGFPWCSCFVVVSTDSAETLEWSRMSKD